MQVEKLTIVSNESSHNRQSAGGTLVVHLYNKEVSIAPLAHGGYLDELHVPF